MASQRYKRLKLDPELFDQQSQNDYEEQEQNQIVQVRQPFSLDDPAKEDREYSSFDSLPNEIIQEICMMLSLRDKMSFRLVSRKIYTIFSDPYLWKNVFIDDAYHKTNAPFVKSVLKTCQPHVQSLSLKGQLPFSYYQSKILNSENIHTLNLYGFEISLGALEEISSLSFLPHLQYLTLTLDKIELFRTMFSCLSHLKKLVIVQNYSEYFLKKWLENNCLPPVLISVGSFKKYNFTKPHCSITHSAHFAIYQRYRRPLNFDFYDVPTYSLQLGPNNPETVAVTANGELMITLKDFVTPTTQPNSDDLSQYAVFKDKEIAPGLPVYTSQYGVNVTVLQFASVTLSLESFRLIVKNTPNVLEVSFKECTLSDCMDAYLAPLSEHCLKLRGLDVYTSGGIDVEHFWYLLSNMQYLKLLSVNCCSLIPPITHSPSSLEGGGSSRVSHLPDIDSTAKDNIISYIKSMSSLKGLCVRDCRFHDCTICKPSSAVHVVHQHLLQIISNLRSLVYLRVSYTLSYQSTPLRSEGFEEVLQNCQQLSVLSIVNARLTLPVNPALYSNLTHLYLGLGEISRITSDFVTALAVNSKKRLKHFVCDMQIEENVFHELVESCYFITFKYLQQYPYIRKYESQINQKFSCSNAGWNTDFTNLQDIYYDNLINTLL